MYTLPKKYRQCWLDPAEKRSKLYVWLYCGVGIPGDEVTFIDVTDVKTLVSIIHACGESFWIHVYSQFCYVILIIDDFEGEGIYWITEQKENDNPEDKVARLDKKNIGQLFRSNFSILS